MFMHFLRITQEVYRVNASLTTWDHWFTGSRKGTRDQYKLWNLVVWGRLGKGLHLLQSLLPLHPPHPIPRVLVLCCLRFHNTINTFSAVDCSSTYISYIREKEKQYYWQQLALSKIFLFNTGLGFTGSSGAIIELISAGQLHLRTSWSFCKFTTTDLILLVFVVNYFL